ncbi:MAG TPA: metallopeptidase family protein [Thermoguttaceae bacterium]|nr:metallopeptidase family protein [Thermoguttaceae bacterium]
MNSALRRQFDDQLDRVLAEMPQVVHDLIEDVPLHVEDYPSARVMAEMGVRYRDALCGLYTGIPLTDRSAEQSGTMPDVVTIYREGIVAMATDPDGQVRPDRLRHEIRTTVLHELAHHHGIDEDELRELGYG